MLITVPRLYVTTLIVITLLGGLSACARPPLRVPDQPAATAANATLRESRHNWWYCRFKAAWPEDTEPNLVVDLLLAHAVVKPVLEQHHASLSYWRFHRRAVRDEAGHQFSFIFYADPVTAAAVMAELNQSAILQQALAGNILERVSFDDPRHPARPNPEDTSDPHWSPEIQRHWPAYIMGVSATWLGLIDDVVRDAPATTDLQEIIGRYHQAHAAITAMWSKEGQHAFIHHLSAIFGYEPLLIRQEIRF